MADPILSLALFVLVATMSPGGATTLATASGARFGFARSVPMLAGLATGVASVAALSGSGLGALVHSFPALQLAMRGAGTAYLLWLAWRIGAAGTPGSGAGVPAAPMGFWGALALLWLNPKAWAIALGAAASFGPPGAGPLRLALTLGGVFAVGAALSLTLWCLGGRLLAHLLRTDRQWRVANAALALLLAASILPMWIG
jgi:threonine/homoserine/homoserine lactone efflux protein